MPACPCGRPSGAAVLTRLERWLERWLAGVRDWRGGATAAAHEGPGSWRALLAALLAHNQWADRAVVIAYAAVTGAVVLAFTLLSEWASAAHSWLRQAAPLAPMAALLWTPALSVALLWWLRRFAPAAAGSGVPQVVRALDDELAGPLRAQLVSLRLSLHKIGLVSGGMLAGLSIGREGPTVQVGAGVMVHARRWLSPQSRIDEHDLMVAGAAAGIAAAFNTPLGGIVFALEQLSRRRGIAHSTLVIAAIVLAGLVAVATFGNETYFGRLRVQSLNWDLLLPGFLVAVVSGLAGGLFSRLLVLSAGAVPDRWTRWRGAHPYRFALACAAAVAVIGLVTGGQTAGAGYAPTRAMLEAQSDLPVVYTALKMCATWLSVWTGLPAGVFSPSLAIGAGIGHDVAAAAGVAGDAAIPLIALGMVGFLAAATQGPITAFIIVMEMVAGHAMVLSLMACAMLAAGLSRLVAHPLYGELARLIRVERQPPQAGTAP
jgi:H+/Cl- antiporter ClcA